MNNLEIGKAYIFDYSLEFTSLDDYSAHRRQAVTVLRQCTLDEAAQIWDDFGNGPECCDVMYKVKASDGWIGDAWDSELVSIAES